MLNELLTHSQSTLLVVLTSFVLSLILTPIIRNRAVSLGWVSRPVEDRWGKRVVARLGGVAIFLGVMGAVVLWIEPAPSVLALVVGVTIVFLIGFVDDLKRMRPYTKLLLQLVAGTLIAAMGVRIQLPAWEWLSIPLTVFWYVAIMNAFNLLDNMDGLAGSIGAVASGFCAVYAYHAAEPAMMQLALALCFACFGFLCFNFPPAKIFMGDSGSHVIGISLAALALMGSWRHSTNLLGVLAVPVLVLAVPIFDMCFVTLQRLIHGRSPFQGGTDHLSHRLAILGLSGRQTLLVLCGLSLTIGALSLATFWLNPLATFALWLAVLVGLLLAGRFLAHVKVYELKREPANAQMDFSDRPATWIGTMLFHKRRILEVLIDFCLICGAYVGAHVLRFEGNLVTSQQNLLAQSLPVVLVVQMSALALSRVYLGVWRYASISDMLTIFKGVSLGSIGSVLAVLFIWRFEGFSRAVFIINWLLLFLGICASRIGGRIFNEWMSRLVHGDPLLIIGAGDLGELTARKIKQDEQPKHRIVGFIDDDLSKQGNRIHGISVLGTTKNLPEILTHHQIAKVILAMENPPQELVSLVKRHCERSGVDWNEVSAFLSRQS